MRSLIIILLLPLFGLSQSNYANIADIPEATQGYWYSAGHRYAAWKAQGWSAADPKSVVVFSFGGVGEDIAADMWGIRPFDSLVAGKWNGKLIKNNGDTIRFLFIGVRDTSFANANYTTARTMIGDLITETGIDTTTAPAYKIIMVGLSNGSNMLNRIVAGGGSGHAWSNYVKRFIHAATPLPFGTGPPVWSRYNGSKIRIHTTTTDSITDPAYATRLRDTIAANSDADVSVKTWSANCHCAWNYAYQITGLNDPVGTHAGNSNEWRIMVDDTDYVPPPDPVEAIRVRLRIKRFD